jgi:hypothetical protein
VTRKGETAGVGPVAYSGEVWTDARGYATVVLPRLGGCLDGDLEYELRAFIPAVTATVAAQLLDGRFTIATDEPHVKVAWRVSARHPRGATQSPRAEM